jgi:hypothetical protein
MIHNLKYEVLVLIFKKQLDKVLKVILIFIKLM